MGETISWTDAAAQAIPRRTGYHTTQVPAADRRAFFLACPLARILARWPVGASGRRQGDHENIVMFALRN